MSRGLLFILILLVLLPSICLGEICLCKRGSHWYASNMMTCPEGYHLVATYPDNPLEHCFLVGKYTGDCSDFDGACLRACEEGKNDSKLKQLIEVF